MLDLGAASATPGSGWATSSVVLGGWSGGGSLSLYYQEQAERPTVTATPAGDPPDLTAAGLIPADAVMLLAAHPSRHGVLTECLDPSIRDEANPDDRDPDLDLYGPSAPTPPYDRAWLARYRQAQIARNRRITAWVKRSSQRCAPRAGSQTSGASSCTAPWPIRPRSTPPSTRTSARSASATSAIRAS